MAEGVIYKDSWSEELLYDQQDEPISLRDRGGYDQRIIAVDYGTTNPMVFLEIYDDGKLFWVTREYYWDSAVEMRQKTDAEYADDLAQCIGLKSTVEVSNSLDRCVLAGLTVVIDANSHVAIWDSSGYCTTHFMDSLA